MKKIVFSAVMLAFIVLLFILLNGKDKIDGWLKYEYGYWIDDFPDFSYNGNMILDNDLNIYEKHDTNNIIKGKLIFFFGNKVLIKSPNSDEIGVYIQK